MLLVRVPETNDHMLQHDNQSERNDKSVHRTFERQAKESALQNKAQEADDQHRRDEAENETAAIADDEPGRHAADHQEFAMREIDDAGQAENQRDADADQDDELATDRRLTSCCRKISIERYSK